MKPTVGFTVVRGMSRTISAGANRDGAPPEPATLRQARADELDRLIAIDDDACGLYAEAGRELDIPRDHPFAVVEYDRWRGALQAGRVFVAVSGDDEPVGFAVLTIVDEAPHLQQLSVRRSWMRRGIGRALVEHALEQAGARNLTLTTYADLPWNRPAYERMGFACVEETDCGEELRRILAEERAVLPAPDQRVAMIFSRRRER